MLTGALALGIGWQLHVAALSAPQHPLFHFAVAQGLLCYGCYSLFTGLGNLLPFKPTTNGGRLLTLLQGGPAWQRQAALLHLTSASYVQQQRPRDWPATELTKLLGYTDQSAEDCSAHYLAYAHALDCQDTNAARHHLQQAIDQRHLADKKMARVLYAEAAYVAAIITQRSQDAQHWLQRVIEVAPLAAEDAFTQAVVAYSCQQYEQATQLLHQCQLRLDALPTSGIRTQGQERLNEVLALVAQQQGTEQAPGSLE